MANRRGFWGNRLLPVFILITISLILFIPSAINRDLHYRDELRYVEVAKEMTDTGQWLVPHLGGEMYSDKPPLYFWILNLFKFITGNYSTISMVLPSIISSIIVILLTYYLGQSILGRKYALLSGLILATSLLYFGLSIFVRMDMMMIVFITATFFSFYRGYISEGKIKEKYYLLVFLFMGIATIIKGPAGFLDPAITIPVFLLLEGNLAELKKMRPGRGFLLFLGVLLAWIVPAVIAGGKGYAYQLLIVQTFGRSVSSFAHQRPFYYYLTTFPLTFFPWSIFLITSFIYFIRKRKNLSWEVKLLLSWFWVPFLLFSIISGKLDIYLLPIYPAASLIVAYFCKQVIGKKSGINYFRIPVVLSFLFFIIIGIFIPEVAEGVALRALLKPAIIMFWIFGLLGLVLLYKKKYAIIPYLIVLTALSLLLTFSLQVVPPLSQGYTKKPLANQFKIIKSEKQIDNLIAYRYGQPETLSVYNDLMISDITNQGQLKSYLAKHDQVLIIMQEGEWQRLKLDLNFTLTRLYTSNDYSIIYKSAEK